MCGRFAVRLSPEEIGNLYGPRVCCNLLSVME